MKPYNELQEKVSRPKGIFFYLTFGLVIRGKVQWMREMKRQSTASLRHDLTCTMYMHDDNIDGGDGEVKLALMGFTPRRSYFYYVVKKGWIDWL